MPVLMYQSNSPHGHVNRVIDPESFPTEALRDEFIARIAGLDRGTWMFETVEQALEFDPGAEIGFTPEAGETTP